MIDEDELIRMYEDGMIEHDKLIKDLYERKFKGISFFDKQTKEYIVVKSEKMQKSLYAILEALEREHYGETVDLNYVYQTARDGLSDDFESMEYEYSDIVDLKLIERMLLDENLTNYRIAKEINMSRSFVGNLRNGKIHIEKCELSTIIKLFNLARKIYEK